MVYAAIEGEERLTFALPGRLLDWAVQKAVSDGTLETRNILTLEEYRTSGRGLDGWTSHGA